VKHGFMIFVVSGRACATSSWPVTTRFKIAPSLSAFRYYYRSFGQDASNFSGVSPTQQARLHHALHKVLGRHMTIHRLFDLAGSAHEMSACSVILSSYIYNIPDKGLNRASFHY
jgi:hypothetical protein